jgi:hypothetical protein
LKKEYETKLQEIEENAEFEKTTAIFKEVKTI